MSRPPNSAGMLTHSIRVAIAMTRNGARVDRCENLTMRCWMLMPSPMATANATRGTARDDDRKAKLIALLGWSAKYDQSGAGELLG